MTQHEKSTTETTRETTVEEETAQTIESASERDEADVAEDEEAK